MKKLWQDFKAFIKRGNVVDMAVGVAVAAAFTAIVTAFTKGFITPLLSLITNQSDLNDMKWVLRKEVTEVVGEETVIIQSEVSFLWGPFVQAIIDFLIIAFTLFLVMRIVAAVSKHATKIRTEVRNMLTDEDEKLAEAEAKEKAEAEEKARIDAEQAAAKAKAEAEAAEEARKAAERKELEEINSRIRQEQLLTEIRDLLKNKD